ncbi:glycoside hydrolase 105 family protein [Photobacterium ganghwense]|uniref:Glycosyl hydrolase family 88 n=1 Tax=Photobacterium ganghwense TaxID=320778 RepID=A0A0J1H9M9_9GAMM|nr:glycoside hydrolase family 88 protein [Photobacterium ganghwense]KLV08394.1 glycosyl hydrolase family 88 [Photobacterium ganghwense]PSU07531.1 glycoside hydrolase 105 family protein [Photobacterium ganghwense]
MNVFPVKHSDLLRRVERPHPRKVIVDKVTSLINNLINIQDETGEFLLHLDDGRTIDTKGWAGWEWTHGIGLYGMYKYYQQTNDQSVLNIIDEWFEDRFAEEQATKNVNTVCPFLTLAYRFEDTKDQSLIPYLETWADYVMYQMPRTTSGGIQHIVYNSENPQQMWDDTLMMSVMPLTKIGLLLNRPEYVEEAKYQFLTHIQYLMDRDTGTWFHGWTFDGNHNFANARWARGNSWVTIVIPDFLELLDLPEHDAYRRHLIHILNRQVEALARYQQAGGLWCTLLDDDGSYVEASATAGFAYGILKAVRKRYIDPKYADIAHKAVDALVSDFISDSGELLNVSFGTAMGDDLDYYRQIPLTSMPYGQAMAILCLSEYLRTYL